MGGIIAIVISCLFVSNIILSSFLGICPFLGISKKPSNASGMGFALIFVVTMSAIICCSTSCCLFSYKNWCSMGL